MFKPGDRVRVRTNPPPPYAHSPRLPIGAQFTIKLVDNSLEAVLLNEIQDPNEWFFAPRFELVPPPLPHNAPRAAQILQDAAQTFLERHKVYGDNYKMVGNLLAALYPNGLTLRTPHEWNRAHIFMLMIVKITRYSQNWDRGGHQDSLRDLSVYCAMLEEIDEEGRSVPSVGP